MGWIARHPGALLLLAAVVMGQVLQKVTQLLVAEPVAAGQVPLMAIAMLAVALVLAGVVVVTRMQLGGTLRGAVAERHVEVPLSLPARYVVASPSTQTVAALLGIVDLVLVLLVQNTLRGPVQALVEHYSVLTPRTWIETAWVALVVVIALVMLVRVFRVAGPVVVLLLWWALDRVVPTVGFAGSAPALAGAPATTATPVLRRPAGAPPAPTPRASDAATVASAHAGAMTASEATVLEPADDAPARAAEATMVAPTAEQAPVPAAANAEEATVREAAPSGGTKAPDADATLVADATLRSVRRPEEETRS